MRSLYHIFERNGFCDPYQQGRSSGSTKEVWRLGGYHPDVQAEISAASLLVRDGARSGRVYSEVPQQGSEARCQTTQVRALTRDQT